MKPVICFICLFLLLLSPHIFSQVNNPDLPETPVINSDIDPEIFKFKARITIQGKAQLLEDIIVLNSDTLNSSDNKKIKIKDVFRINVLQWEKRTRVNAHIFYPSKYELLFHDYRKIVLNGNIELLNRVKISTKKSGYIFLYYHDYFKNGKWRNSGSSDFNEPVSKPAEGCVVSIELIQ